MGKVVLARVDSRLIHGQVATNVSKSAGANALFVADDLSANDEFTKNIIMGAGSRTGYKIRVLKEDGAIRYWEDRQYDDFNVMLITKSIEIMHKIIKGGVPVENLNLGGLPQVPGATPIISEVAINKAQLDLLVDLQNTYPNMNIYFQATPSLKKVMLADAIKLFS
ncbi:PTS system mannose/fructose/N-acetylgalactosamine-transporter subunit IIB [Zophobihabitans entericus]|uniref:PTS sugar transporter subunit IIB n=1 Tax=Zophobihabitans entericus TaxID=1635327 RepID=A0A6G9IEF8_9GAMM|nr:PTS sugar transporter subunit IIB [Zophobihabitans entericus]QIQ22202.1 PTS sugar transporter subunit IIB [Zophobihabitans entericus]